jgi:tetratricopeptide (TPR) repeat protein
MRSVREVGRAKRRSLFALAVVTALGLLAKENAIALVGVVLAYDFAYAVPAASPEDARRGLAERVRGYLALVVPVLAVALVRWRVYAGAAVQRPSFVDNPLVGTDFWTARLTALKVLGRSVALLLWPHTLSWDYSYDEIPFVRWPLEGWEDWQAPLALVGVIAAVVVAVRSRRRRPALSFFLLFALMTILPTANLIIPIGTIMADRFLYLPSVGVAACVVMGLAAIAGRLREPIASALTPTVVAALVLVLGVRTMARNVDWSDEVRLAQSGIESAPRSAKVYLAYAAALSHEGGADVEALIAHTEQALSIMDARPLPMELQESNIPLLLGIFYKTKGTEVAKHGDDARPWYLRSAEMLERATAIQDAQNAEYHRAAVARGIGEVQIAQLGGYELPYHLGELHMLLGEPAKAADDFARLRRRAPLLPQSHLSTARAARATGDYERAVRSLTIAVALGKRDAETQGQLVEAYRRLDPYGCAVSLHDGRAELDGKCPLVRTHLCDAYVELMELSIEAKEWYLGRRIGEAAIKTGDCDAAPFERLLARVTARR